jgi:hypothetical protein
MKFLLKLVLSGGIMGLMAATPHEGPTTDRDKTTENPGERSVTPDQNTPYDLLTNPLNGLRAVSSDEPFTIADEAYDADPSRTAAPSATRVYCGGQYWTHDEPLGRFNGDKMIYTLIHENRIYIRWDGNSNPDRINNAFDNIGILLHTPENRFPNTPEGAALINRCVNSVDPSTYGNGYLGPLEDGVIKCNGKPFTDGLLMGTFLGETGKRTFHYAKIVNGRLRVNFHQIDEGASYDPNKLGMANIEHIIEGRYMGSYQSFMNPDLGFSFSTLELKSCFWDSEPKFPEQDPNVICQGGPTLQGIENVTQTSLQFSFNGTAIPNIKWRIKASTSEVRSGITPQLNGATTASLTFTSLTPGDYILEIEGADCTSSISLLPFTVNEPVVVKPNCIDGPVISDITNITPRTMTVNFTGSNLRNFSWKIKSGTDVMAYGNTGTLTGNSANLVHNYLSNSTYTLELQPEDCIAPDVTRDYVVSATDERPACDRGPSLQAILGSSETSISFRFDGEGIYGIDWKIMQGSTIFAQNMVAPQNNSPVISFPTLPDGVYKFQIEGGNCKSGITTLDFGVNMPLPIQVTGFKGAVLEQGVELTWNVVSQKNGKGFEILRFDDKVKNSEVIGNVSLTDKGTGTYKFIDESPLIGVNYYQLRQIDLDGTSTKSAIISVNPGLITGTIVAPNPASDYVNLQFSSRTSGASDVEIYNISGIKVSTSKINIYEGKNNHRINIGKLNEGSYFIKVSNAGQVGNLRFIKAF